MGLTPNCHCHSANGTIPMQSLNYKQLKVVIGKAYNILRKKGYICRMNFKCCTNCGNFAIGEEIAKKREELAREYSVLSFAEKKCVFWHRQDTERFQNYATSESVRRIRAINGETSCNGLWLTWTGNGHEIVEALESTGLVVMWEGLPKDKIYVCAATVNRWSLRPVKDSASELMYLV